MEMEEAVDGKHPKRGRGRPRGRRGRGRGRGRGGRSLASPAAGPGDQGPRRRRGVVPAAAAAAGGRALRERRPAPGAYRESGADNDDDGGGDDEVGESSPVLFFGSFIPLSVCSFLLICFSLRSLHSVFFLRLNCIL